ncbi:MAG: GlgB N-terminal domain-containing protein, partial [Granulosicoccaceae bacterium]
MQHQAAIDALANGAHPEPFALLGPHQEGAGWRIRAYVPSALRVELINAADGSPLVELERGLEHVLLVLAQEVQVLDRALVDRDRRPDLLVVPPLFL